MSERKMDRENKMVSVIVPVYNTEQYLERCIQSILGQTYQNIELILVDDGSIDKSAEICDKYMERDCRVRVLHKENGGNTSARKAGMEISKGEYVAFVDSDDWIESTMYERMVRLMEEKDVELVCTGYYNDVGDSSTVVYDKWCEGSYDMTDSTIYQNGAIINAETGERNISASLWTKLFCYKKIVKLFENIDLRMHYAEDAALVYSLIPYVRKLYVEKQAYYHYCSNPKSIVHSKNHHILEEINLAYLFLDKNYKGHMFEKYLMREKDLIIADCLFKGLNSSFFDSQNIQLPTYMLPEYEIHKGMKIGIYGAGKVGKCYYNQLKKSGYEDITMIDENLSLTDSSILSPKQAKEVAWDIIIIGVRQQSMAEDIRQKLIKFWHIEADKVKWEETVPFLRACVVDGR